MVVIEQEKTTVRQMVEIYCKGHHHAEKGLCEECTTLLDYAFVRLDNCRYGENKPTCKQCPIHCYKPQMREQMRTVMRYAGTRILFIHPVSAIRHLIRELFSHKNHLS